MEYVQSVGDLLQEELDDIWNAAPKFPDLESSSPQRIDVDSFIEIYRDIDDIFEDEEDDDDGQQNINDAITNEQQKEQETSNQVQVESTIQGQKMNDIDNTDIDDKELKIAFYSICNENKAVTKDTLKNWSEIQDLFEENMLDEDEFNDIWEQTVKSVGGVNDEIGFDGFVVFNEALDKLFILDDEDDDEEGEDDGSAGGTGNDRTTNTSSSTEAKAIPMFYGDDLPAGVIFSELANDEFLIGMNELKRWGDLQDMLKEGDLLQIELQNMFEQIPKAPGSSDKINEEGFESLYEAIDNLFEEEDDDNDVLGKGGEDDEMVSIKNMKTDLLNFIDDFSQDEERMPCGLESTENEMQQILDLVAQLEGQSSNIVLSSGGDVIPTDVAGDWELLYTTSSTMKFNKGLSGLVPPNGKFGGLRQSLKASKYLADIEYIEQINAGPASFEVRVTGDWELRNSVSLFTGSRSVALSVEPDKVNYGVTSQKADHWKSLGPLNLLDIAYLDDDLRIMRGTTSTDSIFVFKKIQ